MDFTTKIDLNKSPVNRAVFLLCFKFYNTHDIIENKLRYHSIAYCSANPEFCKGLFEQNPKSDEIFELILKTNNFIQNVSEGKFIELFGNESDPNYSSDYLKEKYVQMKNAPSYFISTRDSENFNKLMECVVDFI